MKSLKVMFLAAAMLIASAGLAVADLTPAEGDLIKKVDSFDYFVDNSGSMSMNNKLETVKQVLGDINAVVPSLDYDGGLYFFADYKGIQKNAAWDRNTMAAAISKISSSSKIFGRMTDMGDGFISHASVISGEANPKALIIASDGEVNRGPDPVAEAKALLNANPELCLHIISVADSAEGQATLDAIASLRDCTVSAKAADLLADEATLKQFVKDVFYDENEQPIEDVIVLRGVNFAFDSDVLDAEAQGILNEVANIIAQQSGKVILKGYTDSKGSDKYNAGLSQRRANAVKAYLESRGIDGSRMSASGQGKSFSYDNATEEGRYLNRRVEVSFAD